ncbi:MAG: virulence factor SrfB [Hyphomicrobiaceae bacterium]
MDLTDDGACVVDADAIGVPRSAPRETLSSLRIVANCGIQFFDFELRTDLLSLVFGRFMEERDTSGFAVLVPLADSETPQSREWHPTSGRALGADETHWNTGFSALEPFLGQWLPLPYLRRSGSDSDGIARFDSGPANWVRVFLAAPDAPTRQVDVVKGVIAIDTRIAATGRLDQEAYLAPNLDDIRHASIFRLAASPDALCDLLAEPWFLQWLAHTEAAWMAKMGSEAGTPRAALPAELPGEPSLSHIARYLSLLAVLDRVAHLPELRFCDTTTEGKRRDLGVDVDLLVDLDDDRSTALLVERAPLAQPRQLPVTEVVALRDLCAPTVLHTGAFDTYGEFHRQSFGNAAASRLSGRPDAFLWPSLMRIGGEARHLSQRDSALPGVTGLGRLRSGLADTAARTTPWRFSRDVPGATEPGSIVSGEVLAHVSEDGTVAEAGKALPGPSQALRPRFSRSSLLSMFASELVLHALVQTHGNFSDNQRGRLRRLRRVIVTCPADADAGERQLLHKRISAGIELVWRAYGWSGSQASLGAPFPQKPDVVLGLDAGLSAQLLYLFDQIHERGDSTAQNFMSRLNGMPVYPGRGRTTVATLDLASAATSLIVTDYELDEQGNVHPSWPSQIAALSRLSGSRSGWSAKFSSLVS